MDRFGGRSDVVFASHHWPTWGRERLTRFLGEQRDLYAYLHDQTLRMLNKGLTGSEIAEAIQMPPALEHAWHARGYYGSVSHNVKAIYQRYMGWYDGNPAHLWQYPPWSRAGDTWPPWGAQERWWRWHGPRTRRATSDGPQSFWTGSSLPSPRTPKPSHSRRTRWSN
jgi:alkyl sulfatase BDS1-like metallo-beta-lactamase superfamily hydrolase